MSNISQFFDLKSFQHKQLFRGVDYPWQVLSKLNLYIKNQLANTNPSNLLQGKIHPSAVIENGVIIGSGTVVAPFCYIKGPAIIGHNCHIGPGAFIRENSLIGDNSTIGNSSEVKNSILIHHVFAAHFAYLGDSIFGGNIELGAGVKTANLRLDRQPVSIRLNSKIISTELKKLGAIVGDDVSIGCNAVLNPGTVLGKNSVVYPNVSVTGTHPQNSIIK